MSKFMNQDYLNQAIRFNFVPSRCLKTRIDVDGH
jgi:hypothetical protein